MIEFLDTCNNREFEEAVAVFQQGLMMENPPGPAPREIVEGNLKEYKTLVHKNENENINGLLTFEENKNEVSMFFLCAIEPRRGIGTRLLRKLSKYCLRNNKKTIYSTVSAIDEGAKKFYYRSGFELSEEITGIGGVVLQVIFASPTKILSQTKGD